MTFIAECELYEKYSHNSSLLIYISNCEVIISKTGIITFYDLYSSLIVIIQAVQLRLKTHP